MLKAYAVALILSTATPVAVNSVESVTVLENTTAPTTNFMKPGTKPGTIKD